MGSGFMGFLRSQFLESMMKNSQNMNKDMSVMQESMLKMHEQMHKIMDTKVPLVREQLMQAHRHMLHQHMPAMKAGGMMGGYAESDSATAMEAKGVEKHK